MGTEIYNLLGHNVPSYQDVVAGNLRNQEGQLNLLKTQRGLDDDNNLREAVKQFGNDPSQNMGLLAQKGLYSQYQGYQKALYENQEKQSQTGKNLADARKFDSEVPLNQAKTQASQLETSIKNHDFALQKLGGVSNPIDAMKWAGEAHSSGALTDEQYMRGVASLSQVGQDPAAFAQWKQGTMQGGQTVKDQLAQQQAKAIADQAAAVSLKNNETTNRTHLAGIGMQQAGENARHASTIGNSRLLAGLNPDGSPKTVMGADGSIDLTQIAPEDLAAAHRYRTDGTLPPNMGRGAQGAAESRKIRAIATALDSQAGDSPEDARVRQLAAKGDVAALNKLRQREVAVGANVKNFDFNADQVMQLSGKVDRTGVPIANAWINAGRRAVTGNPDLAAYDTAIKTTVNEFAQIVSGTTSGASTEGEKKKAEALLNAAHTPEQVAAVVNQMRIESRNRMASFKAQRAESMPSNLSRTPAPSQPQSKVVDFGSLK